MNSVKVGGLGKWRLMLFAVMALLLGGCRDEGGEQFNGQWEQVESRGKYPDYVSIACQSGVCEWKQYLGFDAQMNSGKYGRADISNPKIINDSVLDWGNGASARLKEGRLYFGSKIFAKSDGHSDSLGN